MADPLGELEESLSYMFELQKTPRQGKYINPVVDELRSAIDNYKKDSANLSSLINAVSKAFPVIENYVDSYQVKQKLKALSGAKESYPSKETETEFITWLSFKTGKNFAELDSEKQVQILLNEQSEKELRVKLGVHLHTDPDFLFNLAIGSSRNFIKLINSRFCFKFEKHQIAKAIYHHSDVMIDESLEPFEQVDEFINFFDKRLAQKGYSIEKLLNDPLAKTELEKMQVIQFYQSPEYKNRAEYDSNPMNLN